MSELSPTNYETLELYCDAWVLAGREVYEALPMSERRTQFTLGNLVVVSRVIHSEERRLGLDSPSVPDLVEQSLVTAGLSDDMASTLVEKKADSSFRRLVTERNFHAILCPELAEEYGYRIADDKQFAACDTDVLIEKLAQQ